MLVAILLGFVILSSQVSEQQLVRPVEVYKRIIEGVHLYFNNTCILMMHTVERPMEYQELNDSLDLKILQAHFSGRYIRTAIMNLKTFEKEGIATWITMAYPTWIIFFRNETSIDDFFSDIFIPFDCVFLVCQQSENDEGEIVTEVYQVDKNSELRTATFATWSPENGMDMTSLALYQRRSDLYGYEIRVVAIQDPPLSIIERNKAGEMVDLRGFFGTILRIIQKSMNCSYSFQEAKVWGTISENGTSTGIVEMLLNNRADLAAVALTMTTKRLNQIAFTTPLYTARCRTYIKKPSYAAIKWEAYLAPFDLGIWESLVILISISSVAILVARILVKIMGSRQEQVDSSPLTFLETLLLVYGAFCGQGIEHSIIDSVRLIHVIIHMTGVIILSAYSAALISFLAVKVFIMPFTTMEGLLRDGTYKFAVVGESADYELFENTTDITLQNMFDKTLDHEEPLPLNYFEGLKKVCANDKYAFMTLENIVAVLVSKLNCTLEPLDVIMQTTNGMAVRLRSPYQGIINTNILMMKDSGIMQRLFANEWSNEKKSDQNKWQSVDIYDIYPLLALLLSGLIVGAMLLSFEHIFIRHFNNCLDRLKLASLQALSNPKLLQIKSNMQN